VFHQVPNEKSLSGSSDVDAIVRVLVWGVFYVPELIPRGGCVGYPAPPCFSTESFIYFFRVLEVEDGHNIW
jgi:hypothetical protein